MPNLLAGLPPEPNLNTLFKKVKQSQFLDILEFSNSAMT